MDFLLILSGVEKMVRHMLVLIQVKNQKKKDLEEIDYFNIKSIFIIDYFFNCRNQRILKIIVFN